MRLGNRHHFSYPGYAEILLLGESHDEVIDSNDAVKEVHVTVLEVLKERLALPPSVWRPSRHGVSSTKSSSTLRAPRS